MSPPGRKQPPPPGTRTGLSFPSRGEPEPQADGSGEDEPLAKVIPMKIFDPFAEADKRW